MSGGIRPHRGQYGDLVKAALDQGWTRQERRRGTMLRSPDGVTSVLVHTSYGESRSFRNTLAQFRRGGLEWTPGRRS